MPTLLGCGGGSSSATNKDPTGMKGGKIRRASTYIPIARSLPSAKIARGVHTKLDVSPSERQPRCKNRSTRIPVKVRLCPIPARLLVTKGTVTGSLQACQLAVIIGTAHPYILSVRGFHFVPFRQRQGFFPFELLWSCVIAVARPALGRNYLLHVCTSKSPYQYTHNQRTNVSHALR
jgi:hypothetical protein